MKYKEYNFPNSIYNKSDLKFTVAWLLGNDDASLFSFSSGKMVVDLENQVIAQRARVVMLGDAKLWMLLPFSSLEIG